MVTDKTLVDPWSLSHLVWGVLVSALTIMFMKKLQKEQHGFSVGVAIGMAVLLHQIFEVLENSQFGIRCAKSLGFPDYEGDSAMNTIGDTIWFTIGCLLTMLTVHYARGKAV